jgi:hypothetical protein
LATSGRAADDDDTTEAPQWVRHKTSLCQKQKKVNKMSCSQIRMERGKRIKSSSACEELCREPQKQTTNETSSCFLTKFLHCTGGEVSEGEHKFQRHPRTAVPLPLAGGPVGVAACDGCDNRGRQQPTEGPIVRTQETIAPPALGLQVGSCQKGTERIERIYDGYTYQWDKAKAL